MNKITFTAADGTSITVETGAGSFTFNGQVFEFPATEETYTLHIPVGAENNKSRAYAINIIGNATGMRFLSAQAAVSHGKPFTVPASKVADFEKHCECYNLSPIKH